MLRGRLAVTSESSAPLVLGLGDQELADARQIECQALLGRCLGCPFALYVAVQALAVSMCSPPNSSGTW